MCRQIRLANLPLGDSFGQGPNTHTTANADPILCENAIHWVFAKETYANDRRRLINDPTGNWVWVGETENSVMYQLDNRVILAYRGTRTFADAMLDLSLALPGADNCVASVTAPEDEMLKNFMAKYPDKTIELTGHSLGGYKARCVGMTFNNLKVVTFNAAAPPSRPVVTTNPNEIDYHIVFDVISAWQTPNTVRIDKGFRGAPFEGIHRALPLLFVWKNIPPLLLAHSIDTFSNKKPILSMYSDENEMFLFDQWLNSLPWLVRKAWLAFIHVKKLPDLHQTNSPAPPPQRVQ